MMRVSKLEIGGYVLLWITIVFVLGVVLERFTNLQRSIALLIVMFVGMVASYPITKWWNGRASAGEAVKHEGRKLTFTRWGLAMLFVSAFVALMDYIIHLQ